MKQQAFKLNDITPLQDVNGTLSLLIEIDGQSKASCQKTAQDVKESLKSGKPFAISFQQVRKRRTLDENAYFHVLAQAIADVSGVAFDTVKNDLVTNYGTPATDSEGNTVVIALPSTVDVTQFWKYARYIGDKGTSKQYIFYKRTSDLNTAEMAKLIDGTIAEARALGIDTDTPRQRAIYGGEHGGK